MPKFRGPNKKRIDPRYFLDEKMEIAIDSNPDMEDEVSPCDAAAPLPKLPNAHQGQEGRMHRTQLAQMISDATMLLDMFEDETDLPEWLEVKITKASDYISSATKYLAGEKSRELGRLSEQSQNSNLKIIEEKPFCLAGTCRGHVRAKNLETGEVVAAAGAEGKTKEQALASAREELKKKLQKLKTGG